MSERGDFKTRLVTILGIFILLGFASHVCGQPGGRTLEKIVATPRVKSSRPVNRKIIKDRQPTTVTLWIVSNPPNSSVSINGEPKGETTSNGELEFKTLPGTYTIRVSRQGYVARESDVEIAASPLEQQVEFLLSPALVSLSVLTDPPESEVYLDEIYKGTSNAQGLLAIDRINPSQTHVLRVKKLGYQQQSNPVTSYVGQLSIKLLSESIRVKIVTEPADAEVYLDDVYKGTTTANGLLFIDQVNPNQVHTVRVKKEGYRPLVNSIPVNTDEATLKLTPDPIVTMVREVKQQITDRQLALAFDTYARLIREVPDHQELPRVLESLLQGLQLRSSDLIRRVSYFGLVLPSNEVMELNSLYLQGQRSRPGDEGLENLSRYWRLKLSLTQALETRSSSEKEARLKDARASLSELGERSIRNPDLLLDLGWAWTTLGDQTRAQKYFIEAQELRPDWAFPHFASGFLAMGAAEREVSKALKMEKSNQAIDSFTRAIALKHDFPWAYALRSVVYLSTKKYEEAITNGQQAIALDPKNAYAHYALGSALFEKGKSGYRNALKELELALALGTTELDEATKGSIQQRLTRIRRSLK